MTAVRRAALPAAGRWHRAVPALCAWQDPRRPLLLARGVLSWLLDEEI